MEHFEVAANVSEFDESRFLEFIKKINDTYADQIRVADQKAAYIFTFTLAFMISSAEGRGVFRMENYASAPLAVSIISALLAIAVMTSVVSAIMAVLPRHLTTSTPLYWGTWPHHRNLLTAALEARDNDYIKREYLANADNLALIAKAKYHFVGIAFRALVVAVVGYVLLLVFG